MNKSCCLYLLLSLLLLVGCTDASEKTYVTPTPHSALTLPGHATPDEPNTLRAQAMARGIQIGTAVDANVLTKEPEYAEVLGREFDILTPENAMKFDALEPAPNIYDFKQADELVAFARAHHMQIHGHNFVWYRALPDWIKHATFTREQLTPILHDFITTVMKRYKGQVSMWDIANEVFDDQGAFRPSIWYQTLGPDFLDQAYRWAHEADPQVKLYYNDYGAEVQGVKSDAIYNLVKGMLARGVPIDGVGFQMHVSIDGAPNKQAVIENMQRFAALGLKVQISEMDVKVQGDPLPLEQKLQVQARVYQDMLSACLAVSACTAFTTWGFTDLHSWIPQATGHDDQPLLFDRDYQRKPAYLALLQTLKQR